MKFIKRLICRLFHKKWKLKVALDDPIECQKQGKLNRLVEGKICMKCWNKFI